MQTSREKVKTEADESHVATRRQWQPSPVILPGESHGQRNLEGYSPWGCKGLDTTERLTLSLSSLVDRPHAIQTISSHNDSKKQSLLKFLSVCFSLPAHLHPKGQLIMALWEAPDGNEPC